MVVVVVCVYILYTHIHTHTHKVLRVETIPREEREAKEAELARHLTKVPSPPATTAPEEAPTYPHPHSP